MKAPFPYFGGKSAAANELWARIGNVTHYIEPFCGSAAVLLGRPHWRSGAPRLIETVNDADGLLSNFWRAMVLQPEELARHADWPVNEADLHARHLWLVGQRERITERLMGDPDWCDPKAAGWWVWGCCAWIGSGWCSGNGPWVAADGVLTHTSEIGNAGQGINRQLPHLGNAGQGGRVWPHVESIAERVRDVRVACGDWRRVLGTCLAKPINGGTVGVFLDPPYGEGMAGYAVHCDADKSVAAAAWSWALEHGERHRVVVAGYEDGRNVPDGWSTVEWDYSMRARGSGYRNASGGHHERPPERLWCSPACLRPGEGQLGLDFGAGADA